MVTSGSENGRYFETNRVNPINLYIFENISFETNPTVPNITGFEVEILMMSFPVFIEITFRAYLARSEYIYFS